MALDTFGIVKDQYSDLVDPNLCIKYQTFENVDTIGHQHCKRKMGKKAMKGFRPEMF